MLSQNLKNAFFKAMPVSSIFAGLVCVVCSIIFYVLDKKNKRLGKKESFGKDTRIMFLIIGCVFLTLGISIGVYHSFLRKQKK